MQYALRNRRWIIFAAIVLIAGVAWRIALARSGDLRVVFLDVGQGDAIFMELPDGNQILIDGGPDAKVLSELSRVLAPWDRSLDVVVATHPDADHLAGLVDVLAAYDVSTVVETGIRKNTALSRSWDEAVGREGARMIIADNSKRLRFGEMASLDLLWPQSSYAGQILEKPNDEGIVSELRYGTTSWFFAADIERWTEGHLMASGLLDDVDVLKIAHHGSKTSTSEAFLDIAQPEIAVISVGAENRYGHPAQSVLDRLAKRAVVIFRTDRDGSVELRSDGQMINVAQIRTKR